MKTKKNENVSGTKKKLKKYKNSKHATTIRLTPCTTKSSATEQENNLIKSLFKRCTPRRPANDMTTVNKPKPIAPYANHAPCRFDGLTGFHGTGSS